MSEGPYLLPIFPLERPIVPGQLLALTLFEDRYLTLAEHLAQQDEPEFGIVGIERGREVGGGETRAPIGIVARVLSLDHQPDQTWRLMATATRRIRISDWGSDEPYPQAFVTDWVEPFDGDLTSELSRVTQATALLLEAALPFHPDPDLKMPPINLEQPDLALWQLVAFCGLGPQDLMELLAIPSTRDRAVRAIEMIDLRRELLDGLNPDNR